jgi:hypothetical protein
MRSIQARLVVLVAGVAVLAPVVSAQPAATPAAKPAPAVAPAPRPATPGGPAAGAGAQAPDREPLSVARGIVKAVGDVRLVIDAGQPPAGQPMPATTFVLDSQTRYQRLGRPLTAKDLRVGDAVTVGYVMRGDKAVAARVWLRTAGPTAAGPRPASAQSAR